MLPKHATPTTGARCGACKKSTPTKEVLTTVATPLKQNDIVEMKASSASTTRSTHSRSMVGSSGTINLTKINFKDMVAAESKGYEEKCIKAFDGWLDYQLVVQTMKNLFPQEPASKWHSMSYEDLVCHLFLYLKVEDAKTVFFDFAVNRHGMSDTEVFEQLKKLKTGVEVAK